MSRNLVLLLLTLLHLNLTAATSLRSTLQSQTFHHITEDPPATPPSSEQESASPDPSTSTSDDEQASSPESVDPLQQALGSVEQTEANLDSVRSDLHGNVEDVQEAAVAVTEHAVNVSAPDAYEKHSSTMEEASNGIASSNASLPEARAATVQAREEARRIELDTIRQQTEEAHKQAEAAEAGGDGANPEEEGAADASGPADDEDADVSDTDALAALGANARVPLLKELVEATRDHTAQTTKYANLALQLQRDRLQHDMHNASSLTGTIKALTSGGNGVVGEDDEESAEDIATLKEEKQETEEEKLLLSPGRAQARAHCADPVLKVAGFKWCVALQQCLQTWEHECPGGEWNVGMKKEVSELTGQLKDMRHQHVQAMIDTLRTTLKKIKKKAGLTDVAKAAATSTQDMPAVALPSASTPAGPGEYGRLKGHVLQLRLQIQKYSKELKIPVPDDSYALKHLPIPTEYQHGLPSTSQGQSNQASQLAARLSTLVNAIAGTKERAAIALMNREVDAILSKLRTMTLGSHCLRCGKGHCDVHERDAMLWPQLPTGGPASLLQSICSCHSLANPRCPCPKKSCAPPPPPPASTKGGGAGGDCDCPKKKEKCGCPDGGGGGGGGAAACGGAGQPRCVTPPVLCEDPGTPMHAVRMGQTYTEGSKLQFLCQPPYKIVGDEFRTCSMAARTKNTPTGDGNGGWRRAGDWSGTQPTCLPPSCPTPRAMEDGVMIGSDFRFPAQVEFKCNVGYTMEGIVLGLFTVPCLCCCLSNLGLVFDTHFS